MTRETCLPCCHSLCLVAPTKYIFQGKTNHHCYQSCYFKRYGNCRLYNKTSLRLRGTSQATPCTQQGAWHKKSCSPSYPTLEPAAGLEVQVCWLHPRWPAQTGYNLVPPSLAAFREQCISCRWRNSKSTRSCLLCTEELLEPPVSSLRSAPNGYSLTLKKHSSSPWS